jgi:hypothetical protein
MKHRWAPNTSGLSTVRLEPGIGYGEELRILGMIFRRELFAAQDDRGRIIVERAATRELLHLAQHRLG